MGILLKNGKVFADGVFKEQHLLYLKGDLIDYLGTNSEAIIDNLVEEIDCKGMMVLPGFIDLHVHGGGGHDFAEASIDAINNICVAHAKYGTTSLLATIPSMPENNFKQLNDSLNAYSSIDGSKILGIYLEGGFVNPNKLGALSAKNLVSISKDSIDNLIKIFENKLSIITVAPELLIDGDLIEYLVSKNIIVSLGHSLADSEITAKAINKGASHFTHLFNAMTQLNSREPGMVGMALLDTKSYVEIIADGHHVHPSNLDLLARTKPLDKICLITDAIEATDTDQKIFKLWENIVEIKNGRTWMGDGRLAGSILTLNRALQNFVKWTGFSVEKAIPMVTENPAKRLGLYPEIGCIRAGSKADIVILDENFNVKLTIVDGRVVYNDGMFGENIR